jgi:hypothetical protein
VPIPPLDQGFLPDGIYECTLEEVRLRFGSFQTTDQRSRLFAKLEKFVAAIVKSGLAVNLLLDGSFVSAKEAPNDIDIIVVLGAAHDFLRDLSPTEYNLLSKHRVRRSFGFDILVALADSEEYDRYVRFFRQIRFEPGRSKGILKLVL